MPTFLLDTNLLVATGWLNHSHSQAARKWFASLSSDSWATCPITEAGFVRISSNPKALPQATKPSGAIEMLQQLKQKPRHVFWEDSLPFDKTSLAHSAIRGHQQITDAYLLSLCIERDGILATFDQGILSLASTPSEQAHILLLTK